MEQFEKTSLFGSVVEGKVDAYEIHMGQSAHFENYAGFGKSGAVSTCQKLAGTYYHGLFDSAGFRKTFLDALAADCGKKRNAQPSVSIQFIKEQNYQKLSAWLSASINLDLLAQKWGMTPKVSLNLSS